MDCSDKKKSVVIGVSLLLLIMFVSPSFAQQLPHLPYGMTFVYEVQDEDADHGRIILEFGWPCYEERTNVYYLQVIWEEQQSTWNQWSARQRTVIDLDTLVPLIYHQQEKTADTAYSVCFVFDRSQQRVLFYEDEGGPKELVWIKQWDLDFLSVLCRIISNENCPEAPGVVNLLARGDMWYAEDGPSILNLPVGTYLASSIRLEGNQGTETIWVCGEERRPLQFELSTPWRKYTARLVSFSQRQMQYRTILERAGKDESKVPVGHWR